MGGCCGKQSEVVDPHERQKLLKGEFTHKTMRSSGCIVFGAFARCCSIPEEDVCGCLRFSVSHADQKGGAGGRKASSAYGAGAYKEQAVDEASALQTILDTTAKYENQPEAHVSD
jgi:hypothetical protein